MMDDEMSGLGDMLGDAMSGLLQSPEDSDDDGEESLGSRLDKILPSTVATQCLEDMLSSLGHHGRKGQKSPLMWKDFGSMSEDHWQIVLWWLPMKKVGKKADLQDPTKFADGHIKDLVALHQQAQQDFKSGLITMSRPKSSRIRMSRPKCSRNRPASHSSAASMAEKFESIDRHSTWIDWLTVPEKHPDDDAGSLDEGVLRFCSRITLCDAPLHRSEIRNVEDADALTAYELTKARLIEATLVAELHAKDVLHHAAKEGAQSKARFGLPWHGQRNLDAAKHLMDDSSRT
jgi:hypothetical protein